MTISPPNSVLTAPADDALGVLTGTATVVREGALVTLDADAAERLAARWAQQPWPAVAADFAAMHFSDGTERTANWMLLVDALNFCFWVNRVRPAGRWSGAAAPGMATMRWRRRCTRAMEEGVPLADAAFLADLTAEPACGDTAARAGLPIHSPLRGAARQCA